MGREGKKEAGWGGCHIQGCTLLITVVLPSEGFFLFNILFCVFLISQLKQPYPLPLQSSGRSNFVYIKPFVFVSANLSEALFYSVVLK